MIILAMLARTEKAVTKDSSSILNLKIINKKYFFPQQNNNIKKRKLFYFFYFLKTIINFVLLFFCLCENGYRGLSFFSLYNAHNDTFATLTILKRTPGISPTE
jgi:hypothetical protein